MGRPLLPLHARSGTPSACPSTWVERYGDAAYGLYLIPDAPIPAREGINRSGRRVYIAPKWPTAPLFDFLIREGISPWTISEIHGIQVAWRRPFQATSTVDRVCCMVANVHPAFVYGMDWAVLSDWEEASLCDFEASEQLTLIGVAS